MIRHKFHAKPTECDGIKFASKMEARYYSLLKKLKDSGEILFFLRQVPLYLPGNTKYVVDFVEFWAPKHGEVAGEIKFVDVKGVQTEQFKLKKRQVEALYPIEIKRIEQV